LKTGGHRAALWRVQIKETLKRHLEKELHLQARGLKVLTLFFIDRVANYRDYDDTGRPIKGKFAHAFETALAEFARDPRYQPLPWLQQPPETLHNGYFAQDKKGTLKDTRGDTQADDDAYTLIMKEKERLLSLDEPLRFIFSHSALREGWDNPNVFQICTLNETHSALAKLTRIVDGQPTPLGRPDAEAIRTALVAQNLLDAEGRIQPTFDPKQPGFTLHLPEPYRDLAPAVIDLLASYQIERHIRRQKDEGVNRLRKEVQLTPEFVALWDKIKPKTTYRVEFSTDELVSRAVTALKQMPKIEIPRLRITDGQLGVTRAGVTATALRAAEERLPYGARPLPDILAYLQNETELTRATLVRILKTSGRLPEFFNNPQRFLDTVATSLKHELHRLLVDGIKYEKIPGHGSNAEWEMLLFKNEEFINYLNAVKVNHSVYEYVVYDSEIEREFARQLDTREDIQLFVKLPDWFKIETPLGSYNPDWAIVKHNDETIYLVRETKSTRDFLKLRTSEADKVRCGQRHFEALGVGFEVVVSAGEV
jgi:type III restriction enzyme